MSRRKNIAIRDLIDLVNRKNRISFCSPETRAGWNSLLDEVLHKADVYRGFRYLSAHEVPAGHLPGMEEVSADPQARPVFPDDSRRQYHTHPHLEPKQGG